MTRYFLGVDTGNTKTHALVALENGEALGFGKAGPGNHETVGYDGVYLALQSAIQDALKMANIPLSSIAGAGFGIAGYDFPSEREPTLEVVRKLGFHVPFEVVNDVVVGLIAGASEGWGVVIDAGTGNNCRGRDQYGNEAYMTGCGYPFGEYGGAGDLVLRSVQMITYDWTQRGPHTQLSGAFVEQVGAKDLTDLIEGLALDYYRLGADCAPLVFQIAGEGDPVAREIIAWAGRELGGSATGIIRQLKIEDQDFEVVLIGSVFNGGAMLLEPLYETIHAIAPKARFTRLAVPPVVGGVVLGMQQVGLQSSSIRVQLIQSTSRLLLEISKETLS
jgi:N-acetylglucosamine kinase-like BadF-type ATPase